MLYYAVVFFIIAIIAAVLGFGGIASRRRGNSEGPVLLSYYGRSVLPPDILLRASVHNPQADRLAAQLNRAASGERTSLVR